MRTDTISYTKQELYRYERDPDGLFEHIGHFFGKRYCSYGTRNIFVTSEIKLGVNLQQVMHDIRSQIEGVFMS